MELEKILKVAVRGGASEIFLKAGVKPRFRFQGSIFDLADGTTLDQAIMDGFIKQLVPPYLSPKLNLLEDLDFAYQNAMGARFRVNLYRQKGASAMVLRVLNAQVRTMEELQMPLSLVQLAQEKAGLILVSGATGSGKSTTIAAMIEKINTTRSAHVITIEDPIELVFQEKLCTISQREVGLDIPQFQQGLRSALRQSPDVILLGELRDRETVETALWAAETGHLVFATLHAHDTVEVFQRLSSYYQSESQAQVKAKFAYAVRAIIGQRLMPRTDNKSLVAAFEILIMDSTIRSILIEDQDLSLIADLMNQPSSGSLQSFDKALLNLAQSGVISKETAQKFATNKKELGLRIAGLGR